MSIVSHEPVHYGDNLPFDCEVDQIVTRFVSLSLNLLLHPWSASDWSLFLGFVNGTTTAGGKSNSQVVEKKLMSSGKKLI